MSPESYCWGLGSSCGQGRESTVGSHELPGSEGVGVGEALWSPRA